MKAKTVRILTRIMAGALSVSLILPMTGCTDKGQNEPPAAEAEAAPTQAPVEAEPAPEPAPSKIDDNGKHIDGYIELVDNKGNVISEKTEIGFSYWDTAHKNSYTEQIIPVPYEQLKDCVLQGEFVNAQGYIYGDWQITFPLE